MMYSRTNTSRDLWVARDQAAVAASSSAAALLLSPPGLDRARLRGAASPLSDCTRLRNEIGLGGWGGVGFSAAVGEPYRILSVT